MWAAHASYTGAQASYSLTAGSIDADVRSARIRLYAAPARCRGVGALAQGCERRRQSRRRAAGRPPAVSRPVGVVSSVEPGREPPPVPMPEKGGETVG